MNTHERSELISILEQYGKETGCTHVQRALRLGYDATFNRLEELKTEGYLIQGSKPWLYTISIKNKGVAIMAKQFDETFNEPLVFTDGNYQISRKQFDRNEAALEFSRYFDEVVDSSKLKEKWVRYQFATENVRDDIGCTHCWMAVPEKSINAQPTWNYKS